MMLIFGIYSQITNDFMLCFMWEIAMAFELRSRGLLEFEVGV